MKKALQVWLEPEVKRALEDQAYASRVSTAEYVRSVLEKHLAGITEPKTIVIANPSYSIYRGDDLRDHTLGDVRADHGAESKKRRGDGRNEKP